MQHIIYFYLHLNYNLYIYKNIMFCDSPQNLMVTHFWVVTEFENLEFRLFFGYSLN